MIENCFASNKLKKKKELSAHIMHIIICHYMSKIFLPQHAHSLKFLFTKHYSHCKIQIIEAHIYHMVNFYFNLLQMMVSTSDMFSKS